MALKDYGGVMRMVLFLVASVVFLSGCAHVISRDVLKEVDKDISFAQLRKGPQDYQGKVVLLGGVIVKTVNRKEGTLLEVYQTGIDRRGKPIKLDASCGRFLAYYEGFLDSEIYRKGREVTIAGIVEGEEVLRLGEIDYRYPYLVVKEIHLWEEEQARVYAPYPWWWDPWYPWYNPYRWYR
jgi:outer membrane lipoprotein